jgi:putative hydrolase of HD superfamily
MMEQNTFERLVKQLDFVREVDRLKQIFRQSYLTDGTRKENDAEHSWHLATMAILLAEYAADGPVDLLKVVKMVLIHDIVEIDAGDTYCYNAAAHHDKRERECRAADRLFNLLPEDQAQEVRALWDEFEELQTPEARFAGALDRLQPMMLNYYSEGKSWREHGITADRVLERNRPMGDGAPQLWEFAQSLVKDAVRRGWLKGKVDGTE